MAFHYRPADGEANASAAVLDGVTAPSEEFEDLLPVVGEHAGPVVRDRQLPAAFDAVGGHGDMCRPTPRAGPAGIGDEVLEDPAQLIRLGVDRREIACVDRRPGAGDLSVEVEHRALDDARTV